MSDELSLEEVREKWEGDAEELNRFQIEDSRYVLTKSESRTNGVRDMYSLIKYVPKLEEGWDVDVKFRVRGSEEALVEMTKIQQEVIN